VWPPPLLARRPLAVQVILVAVLPVAFGALCGAVRHERPPGTLLPYLAGAHHDRYSELADQAARLE
jgi:hypothetical protein